MGDTDQAIAEVFRKIEREKALINAATHMRQSTNNAVVQARVDSNIRDGRRNISYLEDKLAELQLRKRGDSNDGAPPAPPTHGQGYPSPDRNQRQYHPGNGPTPPPKDQRGYFANERGEYGDPGPAGYAQGGTGVMPPRAPYGDSRPYSAPAPKVRPNFSKLGTIPSHG
jgi:hypothetical protein